MDGLHEIFGAELGDKYDFFNMNGIIYYRWTERNEKQIKPNFKWSNCFKTPDSITYKSTKKRTGRRRKISIGEYRKDFPETEPTGYLMPRFKTINGYFYTYDYRETAYKDVLRMFGLKESTLIPVDRIPSISAYRDTLLVQLERQLLEIEKMNREIADVLKVYYREAEISIMWKNEEDLREEEKRKRAGDFSEIIRNIRHLYQDAIVNGWKLKTLDEHFLITNLYNDYLSHHIIDATKQGVLYLVQKKEPIAKVAAELATKLNPLESILQDALMNDEVSTTREYISKEKPHPSTVDERFQSLKEERGVKEAFYTLKEQLEEEGWNPQDYGLRDDPDNFNRAVNKRKTAQRLK